MIAMHQHSPPPALIHAAAHAGTLSLLSHVLPSLRSDEVPLAYAAVLAEMRATIEVFLILDARQRLAELGPN